MGKSQAFVLVFAMAFGAAFSPLIVGIDTWQANLASMVMCNVMLIFLLIALFALHRNITNWPEPKRSIKLQYALMIGGAPFFLICEGEKFWSPIQWWSLVCLLFWIPGIIVSILSWQRSRKALELVLLPLMLVIAAVNWLSFVAIKP